MILYDLISGRHIIHSSNVMFSCHALVTEYFPYFRFHFWFKKKSARMSEVYSLKFHLWINFLRQLKGLFHVTTNISKINQRCIQIRRWIGHGYWRRSGWRLNLLLYNWSAGEVAFFFGGGGGGGNTLQKKVHSLENQWNIRYIILLPYCIK